MDSISKTNIEITFSHLRKDELDNIKPLFDAVFDNGNITQIELRWISNYLVFKELCERVKH